MTWNQHFLKVTLCEKSTFCCILSEMNIFVVTRSRDKKYEFFAYVISQKRRVTLRKKLQNSVAEVKRSPHTKIQLFLSTLKMAKKSRGHSCPRPFNLLGWKKSHLIANKLKMISKSVPVYQICGVHLNSHSHISLVLDKSLFYPVPVSVFSQ